MNDVMPRECRVALRNLGRVDPRSLDQYIDTCRGYSGLRRALESGPEAVIAELERAALRGRGGAGYPTSLKWQACLSAAGTERYAVCDAIDADPAAHTARLLLGGDPHCVLEGLLIGAFAVGASRCFVCINAGYTEESAIVRQALDQMRQRGLLGDDILGFGFSCDVTVKEIAASLVAGEETALIKALEGRQPLPDLRPPYPAVMGLHGKPTLVNAAETLANVSAVLQRGPAAEGATTGDGAADSAPWGGAASAATKVVTVTGDVPEERTLEIPFGTTLGAIIAEVGGSEAAGLHVEAAQFGGPTGAFFAGASLDTPISYEDMAATGSAIGSGTLRVFAKGTCAVAMARHAMSYLRDESCGKCVACREGTYQIADILGDIADCRGKVGDLQLLEELGEAVKTGSICGLGRTASAPLLSSLALFPDDFRAHLEGEGCPGGGGS